jgi:hypothetical protein
MKLLKCTIIKLLLVGLVIVMFIGDGRANADYTFGTPTRLPSSVNSPSDIDTTPCISPDGLELYFDSWREGSILKPDGGRSEDIWVATRATTEDEWGAPVNLGPPVNSTYNDASPSLSADGLVLYFEAVNRPGGCGLYDIWVATRETTSDPWGEPVNLGPPVNSWANDGAPCISHDGLELFFSSERSGGYGNGDIWVTTRATRDYPWSEPVNLGPEVNGPYGDGFPSISADGLRIFFSSGFPMGVYSPRPGGFGECDLWMTRRANKDESWGEPVNLGPIVNTANDEFTPSISSDASMLYFSSMISNSGWNNMDLWQVEILPIVDFNGDGSVDSADICLMVNHWGENYSLCDIGPTPIGDGMVDVQDLIVLAEHLFEDVNDPTLVAHWPLDEMEGNVARDNAGANDAATFGNPLWRPNDGIVYGAIQLDGVDDCIIVGPFPNPTEGPFSVLAWVKGGAPNQVVLSQIDVANWLLADPSEGNLMTEIKSPGRAGKPLQSQTNIADGNWHRIGFIWYGSNRKLYVDGVVVAEDTQSGLESSDNGLYIGCGRAMEPGTFWSGLIDDVRIYNRALIAEEIAAIAQ